LGLERSLSVVPSVSNLRALRVLRRPDRQSGTPFFGLGDPAFEGAAGDDRGVSGDRLEAPRYFRDARGNVDAVRTLSPLPGTREEILALAAALGAGPDAYVLGPAASETALRQRNEDGRLSEARIIVLATHGLLAGAFSGTLAEPALALTPPHDASNEDDGLLTASEAAALRLSADWVILSACNTAAGGEPGASGLTGLARAFFYAGADALLVSHWRVRDDAAARLTTRTFEIAAAHPDMTRAQAFQASMRDLMNDTSADATGASFAHPAAWAPFALIGVERQAP
jgi:CHAT domain-containing protein